jgi:hypothetical protein
MQSYLLGYFDDSAGLSSRVTLLNFDIKDGTSEIWIQLIAGFNRNVYVYVGMLGKGMPRACLIDHLSQECKGVLQFNEKFNLQEEFNRRCSDICEFTNELLQCPNGKKYNGEIGAFTKLDVYFSGSLIPGSLTTLYFKAIGIRPNPTTIGQDVVFHFN